MNQLYTYARQQYLTGQYDWGTADVGIMLLDGTYAFNELNAHLYDIPDGAQAGGIKIISGHKPVDGFATGNGVEYLNFSHGAEITSLILMQIDAGHREESQLIAYYDDVKGFPFLPVGGNYKISPDLLFGTGAYFRI